MFGTRWPLFRLLGIPIRVDASWLIILALLTWTFVNFFGAELPGRSEGAYVAMGLGAAVGFFVCLLLHELGHAVVARSFGIPIRGITLFLFGGVSELEGEPRSAWGEFWMAVAGPSVTAVLAIALWFVSLVPMPDELAVVLRYLAEINFVVLIFNLIPAFPLDGGRVLRSILWGATGNVRRSTYQASLAGRVFSWVLIALGVLEVLAGGFVSGIWLALIGLFLNNAARSSYQQVLVRELLEGEPVARFMNPHPIVVPSGLDLRRWVEDYVYRYHRKTFPVASDGHLAGIVTTDALARYPRVEWDRHTVDEVLNPDLRAVSVAPRTDALDALAKMQRTGSSRLLVMDGDRLEGIVSLKDLLRFLDLRIELGDAPR